MTGIVGGPTPDTPKTVMVLLDQVEAGIVREALHVYAREHVGPVAEICTNLEAGFAWSAAG